MAAHVTLPSIAGTSVPVERLLLSSQNELVPSEIDSANMAPDLESL